MPIPDPATISLFLNFLIESVHVGTELTNLAKRIKNGEQIPLEELQLAEDASTAANDELQNLD